MEASVEIRKCGSSSQPNTGTGHSAQMPLTSPLPFLIHLSVSTYPSTIEQTLGKASRQDDRLGLMQLLMPHLKFTLDINTAARNLLISDGGVFDQAFSTGGETKVQILQRALEQTTYSSLCLPEDLAFRKVEHLPRYYYRDDALKIWFAIN
eukprot:g37592.t1